MHSMHSSIKLLALLFLALAYSAPASAGARGTYGLHLFFNEKDFIDVLTLEQAASGQLRGHMSVPNDFEANLENVQEKNGELSFDLPVPRNTARPNDLLFHYEARLFDSSARQLSGFVTLKGKKEFVAAFVAFKREEMP